MERLLVKSSPIDRVIPEPTTLEAKKENKNGRARRNVPVPDNQLRIYIQPG